ncbi:MAG: DeoR/GlpR family DNA-binding transcription regulator [Planctomycetia bacterium]|nr:DeoR/GlpR family DNA-binding transcription regulator [Planctomycetia bacterium]
MIAEERRNRIVEITQEKRYIPLAVLAGTLGVSESTVRRDVDFLTEQGRLRRTYGGVACRHSDAAPDAPGTLPKEVPNPPAFGPGAVSVALSSIHSAQKAAIAAYTARMVEDGDSILLDGGSTAFGVAQRLTSRQLTLVTNSLPVANLFATDPHSELILVGGSVCPRTGVARGPYADAMLRQIRVKKAIISAAAIDTDGFYNNNVLLVETEKTIRKIAHQLIVVADSSKFGQKSIAHICSLDQATHIVTDDRLAPEWIHCIQKAGVQLHIVKTGNI